jgi:hypothetical protein
MALECSTSAISSPPSVVERLGTEFGVGYGAPDEPRTEVGLKNAVGKRTALP